MQCFVLGGFRTVGVKARIARTNYFRVVGRASLVPESPKALFEKVLRSISGDAGSPDGLTSYLSTRCMAGRKKKQILCALQISALAENEEGWRFFVLQIYTVAKSFCLAQVMSVRRMPKLLFSNDFYFD